MSEILSDDEFDALPETNPVSTKPLSDDEFDALPTEESVQVQKPQEINTLTNKQDSIPSELKGAGLGALFGSIPGLTAELGGTVLEKAAEARSPYTPEQLKLLTSEYSRLKDIIPEETVAKVGEQFSKQNRIINDIEKQAYANLSEPITRQEYQKAIVQSSMPFTREVDETTPEFLKAKEELTPKIKTVDPILKQEAEQLDKFASKKASEIIENKRKASLGTIPEEQLLEEYTQLKNQIKQTKEGFTFKADLEKALTDYRKQAKQELLSQGSGKKAAVKKLQTELAKDFPELRGRLYTSASAGVEEDVLNILKKYKPGELLKGEDAYKLVRDIRQAVFEKDGKFKLGKDAANAAQKAIRDLVGSKNEEASELFEEMSQKIQDLERLEKTGYIKRNKDVSKASEEFIQFGKTQQSKIIKDIAPNLYSSGIDVSGDVAKRLVELKKALPDNLYKELELAVLKIAMDDPAKKATLSNFDLALAAVTPKFAGFKYLGNLISSPKGSLETYRVGKGLQKIAKPIAGIGAAAGGFIGGIGAQAAEEGLGSEESGALPSDIDLPVTYENTPIPEDLRSIEGIQSQYWFERGVRDPEEQRQRAMLASFKESLPAGGKIDEMPSAYEKPEIRQRKEQVMAAKKAGALAPNYVEAPKTQVLKADNPAEIASMAQALQSGQDKASQEYGRVLSQIVDAPAREKESILFGLNQQPAFRELVRKLKDQQKTEEETPLMLRGPA